MENKIINLFKKIMIQIIIHRGTKEIGGSCVEIKTDNTRILIDFGIPLVNKNKKPFDSNILTKKTLEELKKTKILPDIKGLYKNKKKSIDAILISHSHLDHYGFLSFVHPEIPIYMSRGAKELIDITNIFLKKNLGQINSILVKHKETCQIGDIKITPNLVDHSAFDAFSYLIETEGKRIYYSGDFRGHGRKSVLFSRMVEKPLANIDVLLMEGSMLGRHKLIYENERSVENKIVEILKANNNITFLFTSSQNIDRLVSAYRACLKTNKIFVIDLYTAFILERLKTISEHIPQFDWKNIRVKFYKSHADSIAEAGYKDLLYKFNKSKIEMNEINKNKDNILMLARDNSLFPAILKKIDKVQGAKIIYSMWEGYLKDEFIGFIKHHGIDLEQVHTSGHAVLEDLKKFSEALNPNMLIPIHTFEPKEYSKHFKNVKMLKDGEVLKM